jgi:dihydrofolate reductase
MVLSSEIEEIEMIQLVFAHCGYYFGSKDGMPWPHISQDFKNFKARTEGSTIVMGAKTFTTLPGILPGRKHVVVYDPVRGRPKAKDGSEAHQYVSINGFEQILRNNEFNDKVISVIGGAQILELALPFAKKVIKTKIKVHPLDLKDVTQFLTSNFLNDIEKYRASESHCYIIDPTTTVTEEIILRG